MDRRAFLGSTVAATASAVAPLALGTPSDAATAPAETATAPFVVRAGEDREKIERKIWGIIPLDNKLSTSDTGGAVYIFEHTEMGKGGPPRHVHHAQDEWFYIIKGEFLFEVGDAKFRLKPGDSALAPRKIPHVWAHVGDGPGTLLIAVQPALTFEQFFREQCAMTKLPTPEEMARAFEAHGMSLVGPPLAVD